MQRDDRIPGGVILADSGGVRPPTSAVVSAMATPLASIFGSGFLVIVPILAGAVGRWSAVAMAGVGLFALVVGSIVRHNILCAEPAIRKGDNRLAVVFERISGVALVLAYVISICLYLHILASFVLGGFGVSSAFTKSLLVSGLIAGISALGASGGLGPLERMERWALLGTFIILSALLIGFGRFDVTEAMSSTGLTLPGDSRRPAWDVARILAGTLIVVQGFETPRYLGGHFSVWTRIYASRWSQYLTVGIYVLFVALALPLVPSLAGHYDERSLVDLARTASVWLPGPLIVAAALSQFSAAVADSVAASENLEEASRGRLPARWAYLVVGVGAMMLAWVGSPMQIVAIASRAFAFYYLMQCVVAFAVCRSHRMRARFVVTGAMLLFVLLFSEPLA